MSANVIAIDGPAASGKSTVASHLARLLSIPYVNTGSMFRAVTYAVLERKVDYNDTEAMQKLLEDIKLEYSADSAGNFSLSLDGKFLDAELVTPEVNAAVSYVAAIPEVREKLKKLQRSLAEKQRIVMEGRDIGSVVFPDAKWKFFVTASPEVRAKRRLDQSKESYSSATLEKIAASIAERDRIDSQRPIAPLKQCEDAILVDSSNMNVDETVAFIAERII
ncbi:MAG: (d)CMP kinase [Lentisphaeria bacterium]|nr:(d)CMP kinase [Lentisphaeria bacterium]